jgi:predicted nucleic acid-binding protein
VSPILLDTGCIVALLDRSERYHQRCAELVNSLEKPLATCEAVIAKSCYLLPGLKGAPVAVLENVERGIFLIPYRMTENAARLRKLMTEYASVPMDFADACLVDMATDMRTGGILTLDHDFEIYRWGRNRPFDLLIELTEA